MGPLSKTELDAFLAQPLTARLGTVTPEGFPYVTPVSYHWDGASVLISARARARFVANIRADPRACVSITDQNNWSPRVLILGHAAVVADDRDAAAWRAWKEQVQPSALRYHRDDAARVAATWAHIEDELRMPMVGVRVVAEQITSFQGRGYHPKYYR
jgi:hypothetical protein